MTPRSANVYDIFIDVSNTQPGFRSIPLKLLNVVIIYRLHAPRHLKHARPKRQTCSGGSPGGVPPPGMTPYFSFNFVVIYRLHAPRHLKHARPKRQSCSSGGGGGAGGGGGGGGGGGFGGGFPIGGGGIGGGFGGGGGGGGGGPPPGIMKLYFLLFDL